MSTRRLIFQALGHTSLLHRQQQQLQQLQQPHQLLVAAVDVTKHFLGRQQIFPYNHNGIGLRATAITIVSRRYFSRRNSSSCCHGGKSGVDSKNNSNNSDHYYENRSRKRSLDFEGSYLSNMDSHSRARLPIKRKAAAATATTSDNGEKSGGGGEGGGGGSGSGSGSSSGGNDDAKKDSTIPAPKQKRSAFAALMSGSRRKKNSGIGGDANSNVSDGPGPGTNALSIDSGTGVLAHNGCRVHLRPGWHNHKNSVLLRHFGAVVPSAQVAAFDFDNCLARTSVGSWRAEEWRLKYDNIRSTLQRLVRAGYTLVIFTNESLARYKKAEKLSGRAHMKTERLELFVASLGLPFRVFCCVQKDEFRKGMGTAAWDLFERVHNGGVRVDRSRSFFVGDAAGRPSDHGRSDKDFAQGIGLEFFTDNVFFAGDGADSMLHRLTTLPPPPPSPPPATVVSTARPADAAVVVGAAAESEETWNGMGDAPLPVDSP